MNRPKTKEELCKFVNCITRDKIKQKDQEAGQECYFQEKINEFNNILENDIIARTREVFRINDVDFSIYNAPSKYYNIVFQIILLQDIILHADRVAGDINALIDYKILPQNLAEKNRIDDFLSALLNISIDRLNHIAEELNERPHILSVNQNFALERYKKGEINNTEYNNRMDELNIASMNLKGEIIGLAIESMVISMFTVLFLEIFYFDWQAVKAMNTEFLELSKNIADDVAEIIENRDYIRGIIGTPQYIDMMRKKYLQEGYQELLEMIIVDYKQFITILEAARDNKSCDSTRDRSSCNPGYGSGKEMIPEALVPKILASKTLGFNSLESQQNRVRRRHPARNNHLRNLYSGIRRA